MFQLELHTPLTVVVVAALDAYPPELAFFDGHHGFRKVYSTWCGRCPTILSDDKKMILVLFRQV